MKKTFYRSFLLFFHLYLVNALTSCIVLGMIQLIIDCLKLFLLDHVLTAFANIFYLLLWLLSCRMNRSSWYNSLPKHTIMILVLLFCLIFPLDWLCLRNPSSLNAAFVCCSDYQACLTKNLRTKKMKFEAAVPYIWWKSQYKDYCL